MQEYGDAPNLDTVLYWRDHLRSMWDSSPSAQESSLEDRQRDEENLYFQRFDILAPEGRLGVKTGSAPSDADAAIDSLTPTDIQVRVKPARNRGKYVDQADLLARFGRALLSHWRKRSDPYRRVSSDMVIRSVGVARVLYDERTWPARPKEFFQDGESEDDKADWEIRNRKSIPIMFEPRNPRLVRWHMTEDGLILAVAEIYRTTVTEARIALGSWDRANRILDGRSPRDMVEISDVWIGDYRSVLIDLMPVFGADDECSLPHLYPEIPYIIFPFRELPFDEPGRRYRGMLTNASGLYAIESQVLSMHVWMLAWNAWRTWKGWTIDKRKLRIVPGEMIPINQGAGEYLELLQGDPVPPELLNTASVIDSYIQRNGVAQGPRTQEGTRSAQQVWAIQSIRQIKVEPGKQALQRGLERALMLAAQIIERFMPDDEVTLPVPGNNREGKPLGEVRITAKDIAGYDDAFDVTFGRRLDPALLEQAKALMGLSQNNWMPRRISWELSGLTESPSEWEDELIRQGIEGLDYMTEIAGYEWLTAFYEPDDWRITNYQMRMQSQPPPNRGGRNGGGFGPARGGPGAPAGGTMQPTGMPAGPAANAMPQPGGASRSQGRLGQTAPRGAGGGGMPGNSTPGG